VLELPPPTVLTTAPTPPSTPRAATARCATPRIRADQRLRVPLGLPLGGARVLDGAVDWLCWPRFDSPAVFAAVLDSRQGGTWSIRPEAAFVTSRNYLPQTNVVETHFRTETGAVRVTDWLHIGARQALCRRIEGVSGHVAMRIDCDPRPDFNATGPVEWTQRLGWLVCDLPDGDRLVADGLVGPTRSARSAPARCTASASRSTARARRTSTTASSGPSASGATGAPG
jgi:hypothetical protein